VFASRTFASLWSLVVLVAGAGLAQTDPKLETYFRQEIGLSAEQIQHIRDGKVITKALKSKDPDQILIFGATYVRGDPAEFVRDSREFQRLRRTPGYLAFGTFSDPPVPADLKGFTFEEDDISSLRGCKAGDCGVQLPTGAMQQLQTSIDWSKPDARERVDDALRQGVLERLHAYQREGNAALGVYNDKENPVNVDEHFRGLVEYSRALPKYLPDFYHYLLSYPQGRPAETQDAFYWAKVKFGLKPTLRVVHVMTWQRATGDAPVFVSAEKQLYASHYFRTALALTFCIPGSESDGKGFYLIRTMGSDQGGMSGFKGSMVRKKAVGQTLTFLRKSIESSQQALQAGR
jgi:hypothetical protein